MIPGKSNREASLEGATLDDLFRRAGVRRNDALALADPPNRARFADGTPRQLTYAQADRVISNVATRLRGLGFATDTVIALQLPNTVESALALLGVLRAGMIAALPPILWRKHDLVAACASAGAKAIVTQTRNADDAMQAAAELFAIRHVCAFGRDVPDGVVALDDCFTPRPADFVHPPARAGIPSAHVAVITFDVTSAGVVPVARSHAELIAGGLAVFLEARVAEDAAILSTIPLTSIAGLSATLMPWLIGGGTLALHHGFDAESFTAQCRALAPDTQVLPAAALAPLASAGLLDGAAENILALWRAPERLAAGPAWTGKAALTDIACIGETGLLPARRAAGGLPVPIPDGTVTAPATGLTVIGGYRFRQIDVDRLVAEADKDATVVALPDALLGQRFAGNSPDLAPTRAELQARGVNPLIAGAFRPRARDNAA